MTKKIVIFAIEKQSNMSEEQKKVEEEFTPDPEGFTFTVYSFWEFGGIMAFGMFTSFFCAVYCVVHSLYSEWMIPVFTIAGLLVFFVIGRKLCEATVNVKLTDIGLEQRRLSGSRFVPEYRMAYWNSVAGYFSSAWSVYLHINGGTSFLIQSPFFAVFERPKSWRDNFYAFQSELYKMAKKYGIKEFAYWQGLFWR